MLASSPDLAKELAENAAWLRRIARSLVGAGDADDLVQETMEAALRQPPATDRPLRPWLRRVLSNAAKGHWRSSGRRQRREEQASAPQASESPAANLERLELQRELTTALLALDEPYRQAIILRFVEGLSAAAVADKLGIPASTVRSQVQRGLERLRSDLDRESSVPTWRAVLAAPFFSQDIPAIASPPSLGAFVMKLGIVLTSLIAAVLALIVSSHSPSSSASPSSALEPEGAAEPRPQAFNAPLVALETRRPVPAVFQPRRFQNPAERDRFAAALANARRGGIDRQTKTYDFSGVKIAGQFEGSVAPEEPLAKLDKNYIRRRISEIIPLVAECHELASTKNSHLAGALTVDFVVEAEAGVGGFVSEAGIAEDSPLQDHALAECVTETILSLEFVAPEDGGIVRVRYPFIFAPPSP